MNDVYVVHFEFTLENLAMLFATIIPGDITILCRECGEEFYIEEQNCEGYNWTVKPQGNISLGIECPNCNAYYY